MKKITACLLLAALLAALVLSGCGAKAVFSVSSEEDNTISVTAERAPKDSVGLGYLSVGEGGQVVVETSFKGDGMILVRLFAGLLGTEEMAEEPSREVTLSGEGSMSFEVEPGEYTVAVKTVRTASGTARIRVEGGEPFAADGSVVSIADDSITIGDLALRPEGEAGRLYDNGGFKLLIPLEYDELLLTETLVDDPGGKLFSVTEKASLEAADGEEGAGWLFDIGRIDEETLHELLCFDRSGMEVFAGDADGGYLVFYHPTDVRFVRESAEAMKTDQEQWTELNAWARGSVRDTFLRENPGLSAVSYDDSELALYLGRAAYHPETAYTVSTTQYGPLEPKQVEAAPYVERLLKGARYEWVENGEAPDGEYVVLNFPDEETRFDFFLAEGGENLVRMVWRENETLFEASFADDTKASAVMQEWYDALAAERD